MNTGRPVAMAPENFYLAPEFLNLDSWFSKPVFAKKKKNAGS
jgi:hypothetical protein